MAMTMISFGNVSIRPDGTNQENGKMQFTIFIQQSFGEYTQNAIECTSVDSAILYALQLKYEGNNGAFAGYAQSMLGFSDEPELG